MGKPSSSSLKKKRSRASSPVPMKRKSKSERRPKSKKISRRRHDSDSVSSGYNSSNPASSFEDDYRARRRRRSPAKKKSRRSKKRSRRHSYSLESSEDSPPSKRRKSSRRDRRKKTYKKRSRRSLSVSSASSGSFSCSTCGGSDGSEQSEWESYKVKSEIRDVDRQNVERSRTETKRTRWSSRSCSSCSQCSIGHDDKTEENVRGVNNTIRLRSIILVNNQEITCDNDGHKEEITYDNDDYDYPSCRSNDSNDGGSKREYAHHVDEFGMNGLVDSEKDEQTVVSEMRAAGTTEKSEGDEIGNKVPSVIVSTHRTLEENKIKVSDSSGGNDLESILRRKALENLRRFQGLQKPTATSSDRRDKMDCKMKQPLDDSAESSQGKIQGDKLANATHVKVGDMPSPKVDPPSVTLENASRGGKGSTIVPSIRRVSAQVGPEHGNSSAKGGPTKQPSVKGLHDRIVVGNARQEIMPAFSSSASKPRVTPFTWRRESVNSQPLSKESHASQESPQAKRVVTEGVGITTSAEKAHTERKVNGDKVHEKYVSPATEPPSCPTSTPEVASSVKDKSEAKDDPQLEQKTMSVTRGGETIQVNYQVYIPKRAAALARRQLNRG